MEANPDTCQVDSGTMEEAPYGSWKTHSGPSQEDLGATEKSTQIDLKTYSEPDKKALGALSRLPKVGLQAWAEQPKENFEQAQVPLQDCLNLLPQEEHEQSLIDSIVSTGLSQETKIWLPLKTEDEKLLLEESVERAQIVSSVKQETGESQTRPPQASFSLETAQKPSQKRAMWIMPLNPQKSEEPQTSTFQVSKDRKSLKKKRKNKRKISHEIQQLQRSTTNSQTESPQHVLQDSVEGQSSFRPRDEQREPKEPLCLYSHIPHILRYMKKGVILNIMSHTESGLLKKGKHLYVCDKFLMGKCEDDLACPGYHTVLPFHWQLLWNGDNSWHSVSCGTQLHLEMLYSDPNNSRVSISEPPDFLTSLDMISQSFSRNPRYSFCRRISCQKDSFITQCYKFYWFNGKHWTLFNQDGPCDLGLERTTTMDDGRQVLPYFENSLKMKNKSNPLTCCRPEYTPLHLLVHNLSIWNLEKTKELSIWDEDALDLCLKNYPELKMKVKIPGNQDFILMEIWPSEPTYQYCCKLFYSSMNSRNSMIFRIFRLYNPKLWEQYKRQKETMAVHKAASTSLEYHLFHETTVSLEHLAANGFDSKLSKRDGILGYGTYFALHARTAALMNSNNPYFGHVMVLAKVLVGENTIGKPGLQAPPFKPDGQQFDSCVNNTHMPTLFLLFKEECTFPRFIILYRLLTEPVKLVF